MHGADAADTVAAAKERLYGVALGYGRIAAEPVAVRSRVLADYPRDDPVCVVGWVRGGESGRRIC